MDGLILDTEPFYKYSSQKAADELGYDLTDELFLSLVGRPNHACDNVLMENFGPDFPLESYQKRWPVLWREKAESTGISIKPGFFELMSFLSEKQLPYTIATSTHRNHAFFTLETAGIAYFFKDMVTGNQVENGKPAPDIYLEAARLLDVEPAHCVALEDSEAGITSATSAGMKAIMVPDMKQPSEDIRTIAYDVVDSLLEARDLIRKMLIKRV